MFKFTNFLCVTVICCIFFTSCYKGDVSVHPSEKGMNYPLSTLPISPAFATSLAVGNEHRDFSISLKDGAVLHFELNGAQNTFFGTRRTLAGSVSINGVKEHSVMMIANNGFGLYYQHQGHIFAIKSNVSALDYGYKDMTIDLESAKTKAEFAAYAVQNGSAKADALVAAYKNYKAQPVKAEEHKYNVILERTNNYTLEDQTLTVQARQKVEGIPGKDELQISNNNSRISTNAVASSSTAIIADGTYSIQCKNGNVFCGIAGSSLQNLANFQVNGTTYDDGADGFTFTSLGNNIYTIKNSKSGLVLDATGGGTGNSTKIIQYSFSRSDNQKWKLTLTDDGSSYYITGVQSNRVIDEPYFSTAVGNTFTLYDANGGNNQKFYIKSIIATPPPAATYSILNLEAIGNVNSDEYSWLIFSFISIDPSSTHLSSFPNVIQFNVGSSIIDIVNLLAAITFDASSTKQISKIREYGVNFNKPIAPNTCRVAFYPNLWDDAGIYGGTLGKTYQQNTFSKTQASYNALSIVSTSNSDYGILGHEIGHILGAGHVNDGNDIMYMVPGSNFFHYDATNLQVMRAKFGF